MAAILLESMPLCPLHQRRATPCQRASSRSAQSFHQQAVECCYEVTGPGLRKDRRNVSKALPSREVSPILRSSDVASVRGDLPSNPFDDKQSVDTASITMGGPLICLPEWVAVSLSSGRFGLEQCPSHGTGSYFLATWCAAFLELQHSPYAPLRWRTMRDIRVVDILSYRQAHDGR